jgi:hypothetical protein
MCGCEHHWDTNAPCTCTCPEHESIRREMKHRAETATLATIRAERDALAAAVDRVRNRHPRGDEEPGPLAPGLWCPTCGHERTDNGYGACPDRQALSETTS